MAPRELFDCRELRDDDDDAGAAACFTSRAVCESCGCDCAAGALGVVFASAVAICMPVASCCCPACCCMLLLCCCCVCRALLPPLNRLRTRCISGSRRALPHQERGSSELEVKKELECGGVTRAAGRRLRSGSAAPRGWSSPHCHPQRHPCASLPPSARSRCACRPASLALSIGPRS